MRRAVVVLMMCAAGFLLAGASLTPQPIVRSQDKQLQREQDLRKVFTSWEEFRLDPQQALRQVKTAHRLTITTLSRQFDLYLELNDLRAPNYRAEEVSNGVKRELGRLEVTTYRGTVKTMPGADARFTIDGHRVEGMILAFNETYFVEPANKYSAAAEPADYLLYRDSDVRPDLARECAVTLHEEISVRTSQIRPLGPAPNMVVPMRIVELATEADDEYVAALGGSAAANSEILSIMNQVDAIFRRDVGLTFSVVFQHTFNGGDPYTTSGNASAVLNEFTNYWNANITNPRDQAHMWTGRSLGGPAGVAWQGVICRAPTAAYGLSVRQTMAPFRVGIPAHELGHNYNASHSDGQAGCDNTIMAATQTNSTALAFCQFSVNELTTYVDANNVCLSVAPGPTTPVIFTETGTSDVAALDSVTFVRGPFRRLNQHNFSLDQQTRIIFFTSDLGLTQPNASLSVQASGTNLPVEGVGPLSGVPGLTGSYLVVRLPSGLPTGDLPLTVTLGSATSGPAILKIVP